MSESQKMGLLAIQDKDKPNLFFEWIWINKSMLRANEQFTEQRDLFLIGAALPVQWY